MPDPTPKGKKCLNFFRRVKKIGAWKPKENEESKYLRGRR